MRKPLFLLLAFLFSSINTVFSQTRVTFQNDKLLLEEQGVNWNNPKQFYPLGWYGPQGSASNLATVNGFNESMSEVAANGSNTVLHYWNGIIDRYLPYNKNYADYTLDDYEAALQIYLDDVASHGLKAIVQIPTEDTPNHPFLTNYQGITNLVNDVEDHPALLGWYQADEPEDPNNQGNQIPYSVLRTRYTTVKNADSTHPIFVVFVNGNFRCQYTEFCGTISGYSGPVYDVLMIDRYQILTNDNSSPHFAQYGYRTSLDYLREAYLEEYPSNGNSSAAMFVAQGFGQRDITNALHPDGDPIGEKDWRVNGFYRRNPSLDESLYAFAISSYFINHNDNTLRKPPVSGLLFWSHRYADQSLRNDINKLTKFISDTELQYVFSLKDNTQNISFTPDNYGNYLWSMLREYKDSYYLLVINDQQNSSNFNTSINNIAISLSGVDNLAHAHQLVPEGGDAYYRKWVPITNTSSGNYSVNPWGNYSGLDDFSPYEVKIFRFAKAITWANIYGPTNISSGTSYLWTANASGDNSTQTYYWYKQEQGTSTWDYIGSGKSITYSHYSNDSFTLKVKVNNHGGASREAFEFIDIGGGYFKTSERNIEKLPTRFNLEQNYPNPFNPSTTINYAVPELSNVKIEVYTVDGRLIETLINERKEPGFYSINFNANDLTSGIYFYKIEAGSFTQTKKLTLIK